MRSGFGRVTWREVPVVAWLLVLALLTVAPGEPNVIAAVGSGCLGAAVYAAVIRLLNPRSEAPSHHRAP